MSNNDYIYDTHELMIRDLTVAGLPLANKIEDIQKIYLSDNRPWIVGFSGGKDSTTVLSLIYSAIACLEKGRRHKDIYVVSSDTLVETPVVVDMFQRVIDTINCQAPIDGIPMSAHTVMPEQDQTFWVNLLGRGYPAPTTRFRWCTERMKINPISSFIVEKVSQYGEVIVCLGSRRQESSTRAQVIARHRIKNSPLGRHTTLPNAYTYMPIEHWDADDVWQYLMSSPCPWGGDNNELFDLYRGSNQGECPIVIDTSTPSCGNSRFGCWTCTLVSEDRAINGLIKSGSHWMQPLLEFRNELYKTTLPDNSRKFRNYKRRTGKVFYMDTSVKDGSNQEVKHVPGPYLLKYRKKWLKKLLGIEKQLTKDGHPIQLIERSELQIIRQEWLRDPNEPDWEDSLPEIYETVYPDSPIEWSISDTVLFSGSDAQLLRKLGEKRGVPALMIMKLIEVEQSMNGLSRRTGILKRLESVLSNDWESLDEVTKRYFSQDRQNPYSEKLAKLEEQYEALN